MIIWASVLFTPLSFVPRHRLLTLPHHAAAGRTRDATAGDLRLGSDAARARGAAGGAAGARSRPSAAGPAS